MEKKVMEALGNRVSKKKASKLLILAKVAGTDADKFVASSRQSCGLSEDQARKVFTLLKGEKVAKKPAPPEVSLKEDAPPPEKEEEPVAKKAPAKKFSAKKKAKAKPYSR